MVEHIETRKKIFDSANFGTINKYSAKIKEIEAGRLEPFSIISEIEYIIEKGFAISIQEALNLNDNYLTLSMAKRIIDNDIDTKFNDYLMNKK